MNEGAAPAGALRRAVFLDRDGVINRSLVRDGKPYAPRRLTDFRLLPGAANAVRALQEAGLLVIVVTNQPDIGNGLVAAATVEAMHETLRRRAPVDDIFLCPHAQGDGCDCRKPKPGMLLQAAARWCIDLPHSFLVGDRRGDIVAGQVAGCYTIFIDRGYVEGPPREADHYATSLPSAVRKILSLIGQTQHVRH